MFVKRRTVLCSLVLLFIIPGCFYIFRWPDQSCEERINMLEQSVERAKSRIANLLAEKKQLQSDLTGKSQMDPKFGPIVYAVTPTYARLTQKADLTRLAQTFLHVRNFHWILVEDSPVKTSLVTRFLASSGLTYSHLAVPTPKERKLGANEPRWRKARGVAQRNLGINFLVQNKANTKGVVYFADDDNTYDVQIFDQMRFTRRVSVWPVGLTGGLRFEGPVCSHGKIVGWHTSWHPERPFPLDMAGFAVNLAELVNNSKARIDPNASRGYLESSLLSSILKKEDAEPLANDCTKVLVWHTRTEHPKMTDEERLLRLGKPSNPNIEI
eukprot:m.18576 g.18576  ORF g.18576 m.18576 type:complete len:326 (+) comp27682_c0_seq1:46-1023(+)